MQKGTVIKVTGSWYTVLYGDDQIIDCRIIGKFRLDGKKLTNPVAVGDQVSFGLEVSGDEDVGVIKKILPRQNYVMRQSPRKKHDLHLIASNIHQAVLVTTIKSPALKPGFIDRYLLMTEPHDIPTIILFTKFDLYDEDDKELLGGMKYIYEDIGYTVHHCSNVTGEGIPELRAMLKDKITLFGGQSGVGKSTVINSIQTGLGIRTQDLSDYTGKGQHTTTFAEMFPLDDGGHIIDTPGIKTLSFNNMEVKDVAHNFREFFEVSKGCKFGDCTHRNEPKCAVKNAIEDGDISEIRYENYLRILSEIEDQNYWERRKDF